MCSILPKLGLEEWGDSVGNLFDCGCELPPTWRRDLALEIAEKLVMNLDLSNN